MTVLTAAMLTVWGVDIPAELLDPSRIEEPCTEGACTFLSVAEPAHKVADIFP